MIKKTKRLISFLTVLSIVFSQSCILNTQAAGKNVETKFHLAILNDEGLILFSPHSNRDLNDYDYPEKWGLMTLDGKFLIDGQKKWLHLSPYSDISEFFVFPAIDTFAAFGSEDSSEIGVIDHNFNEIIPPRYQQLKVTGEYAIGRKPSSKDFEVIHLTDLSVNIIHQPQFSLKEVEMISDSSILIYHDGKSYFTDLNGNTILTGGLLSTANVINPFYEGLAAIEVENPETQMSELIFIDKTGRQAFPQSFQSASDYFEVTCFSEGRTTVRNEDYKVGVIDTNGNIIVDYNYDYITNFRHGEAEAGIRTDSTKPQYKKFRIGLNGEILGEIDNNSTHPADNWYTFEDIVDNNTMLYGFQNDQKEIMLDAVYTIALNFRNGITTVVKDGKVHIIDSKGKYIIKNLADVLPEFYARS